MNDEEILLAHPDEGADRLVTTLRESGFKITHAETATEALAELSLGEFGCIVSRYELPGDDGLSLFKTARTIDERVPFVLYADVDEQTANEAFTAGVDRFVSCEPQSMSRLIEEMTELISPAAELTGQRDISGHEPDPEDILRAVENAPIGITLCDPSLPDTPIVYVNEAWQAITGYDSGEALGRNPRFLQGPGTDRETRASIAAAIETEQPVTRELRNYRRDGTPFWNELTLTPVFGETGDLDLYIGFQNDVTARKDTEQLAEERAAKLTEERQSLRRILSRINGLLSEITQTLVTETQRSEITETLCTQIVNEPGYAASWFGAVDITGEQLEIEASAGFPTQLEGRVALDSVPTAVAEAIETGEVQLCVVDPDGDKRLQPAAVDARRLAVVPISDGHKNYGLLGVYGEGINTLDRREQQLFRSIGTMIASRLNAIETTEIITTESIIELQIAITDETFPLSAVARELGTDVEYVGLTEGVDGDNYELFVTAADPKADSDLSTLPFVEQVREVSQTESAHTFALSVDSATPFVDLADYGASVASVSVTDGQAQLVVEVPPNHDVRTVVELLESLYDGVELRSQRQCEAREQTVNEFASRVEQRLTQRQHAAIQAAYLNGYFEWPRPTDGGEVAETMGITRQTFHQHLRAAEQKLVDSYIDCVFDPSPTAEPQTKKSPLD